MAGVENSIERWNSDEGNATAKNLLKKLKAACTAKNEAGVRELVEYIFDDSILAKFQYEMVEHLKSGSLFIIAEFGSANALQELVFEGLELDVVDEKGASALHLTMFDKNLARGLEKAKILIDFEAHVKAVDDMKRNLLHTSAWKSNEDAVKYFLSKGLDVNGVDEGGKTPLHYGMMNSVENSALNIVYLLLDNGADAKIRDKGRLPLDIAEEANCKFLEKLKVAIESENN